MRFTYSTLALFLLLTTTASAACIDTRAPVDTRDASVDGGPVASDLGTPQPYDPVTGMPFTGPLLIDDARVQALDPSTLRDGDSPCHAPALVQVIRGVDGDTFHVSGLDGVPDTDIRLIGIDAPELNSASTGVPDCYGAEARDFIRMNLAGHYVWLTFGNGRDCLDPFDRTLAYAFLGGGEGDMVQRQLLRRGLAKAYIFRDNATYETLFTADEDAARVAGAGQWSACPAP